MCEVAEEKADSGVKDSQVHRVLGCTVTSARRGDMQGYGSSKARPRPGTIHLSQYTSHNPRDRCLICTLQMKKARSGGGYYTHFIDKKWMFGAMSVLPPATPH